MGKYIVKKLFNAEKYALICSPYIDEYYADAILRLAERGISVKVIASNRQAGRLYLEEFFEEYEGKDENFDYILVDGEGFVHVKLYVIDGNYAADGSPNLTRAGMWNNVEHLNVYESYEEVQNLKKSFEKIWEYNEREAEKEERGRDRGYGASRSQGRENNSRYRDGNERDEEDYWQE